MSTTSAPRLDPWKAAQAFFTVAVVALIFVPQTRPWNWGGAPASVSDAELERRGAESAAARQPDAVASHRAVAVVKAFIREGATDKESIKYDVVQTVDMNKAWLVQASYSADGVVHGWSEFDVDKATARITAVQHHKSR